MLKVAVTDAAPVSVTEQAPVPLHAPDHPANVDPDAAVAVSVTAVPLGKFAVHVVPQLIPDGALVTVPDPVPASVTVSCSVATVAVLKVAVTDAAFVRVTVQAPVPLHPPDHPANVDPDAAVAVSVTAVPLGKFAEHVVPQLIPDGALVTVPDPVPPFCTVSVSLGTVVVLKVAATDVSPPIVRLQLAVPLHAPPHPANVVPDAAVAVRVTFVPTAKVAEQVFPQLIPLGVLVMVPLPVDWTVRL